MCAYIRALTKENRGWGDKQKKKERRVYLLICGICNMATCIARWDWQAPRSSHSPTTNNLLLFTFCSFAALFYFFFLSFLSFLFLFFKKTAPNQATPASPAYPEWTAVTPRRSWKQASTHQKHPPPNVASADILPCYCLPYSDHGKGGGGRKKKKETAWERQGECDQ